MRAQNLDTAPATGALIQFRALEKPLGQQCGLRGIDHTVKRGEVLAIIHEEGSGKTTPLR
ncbi:hypothetical protein GCM10011415_26440 [Salipiger pallidus]|uniref:Uncharacterized protein n=1 Tax=Salipiger pallidus TaxID=1775170 RepID=A0A8J3EGX6_9RHOB|nr:hypothetical protein [Salipiger pallidus]GGG76423.1 hypothetical protein GCM10011415_26440 [Salipiger pallidus]